MLPERVAFPAHGAMILAEGIVLLPQFCVLPAQEPVPAAKVLTIGDEIVYEALNGVGLADKGIGDPPNHILRWRGFEQRGQQEDGVLTA